MAQGAFTVVTGISAVDPESLPLERVAHASVRGRHLEESLREHLRGHLQLLAALSGEGLGLFPLYR